MIAVSMGSLMVSVLSSLFNYSSISVLFTLVIHVLPFTFTTIPFLFTTQVLSALWLIHIALVRCKLLTPKISLAAGAWSPEVMTSLLLNSVVLGVLCR